MSSVISEHQRQLVLDLLLGRIAEGDFVRDFPVGPDGPSAAGLDILRRSVAAQDSIGAEFGLYMGHRFGITAQYLDVLCELATAGYHQRHEDVVSALADLKLPASVDALYGAVLMHHPYRDYDEAHSLELKAIRALSNIETPEALEKLALLLHVDQPVIAAAARKRLGHVAQSGHSSSIREQATRILEKS